MENAKVKLNKNKTMKIVLCYFGLVVLVVLLALPPVLRLAVKDEAPPKQDVVTTLECIKANETVKSTFLNEEPKVISYKIKGDQRTKEEADIFDLADEPTSTADANSSTTTDNVVAYNEVLEKMKSLATETYDEKSDTTVYSIDINSIKESKDYTLIFNNASNQENYFKSKGFSCNKTSLTY